MTDLSAMNSKRDAVDCDDFLSTRERGEDFGQSVDLQYVVGVVFSDATSFCFNIAVSNSIATFFIVTHWPEFAHLELHIPEIETVLDEHEQFEPLSTVKSVFCANKILHGLGS